MLKREVYHYIPITFRTEESNLKLTQLNEDIDLIISDKREDKTNTSSMHFIRKVETNNKDNTK